MKSIDYGTRTDVICLRIPSDLKAEFKQLCDEHGEKMSAVLVRVIQQCVTWQTTDLDQPPF